MARREFVFGYGSLVIASGPVPGRAVAAAGFVADLAGFERVWGVAMDNRRDVPGYKYYTDERGRRPAAHIAYLDIRERSGASVTGVCVPVDDARLAGLDVREHNYERVDVSKRLGMENARVWTYVGTPAGRRRLAQGRACGRVLIDAGYLEVVRDAFRRLGPAEYERCAPSLDPAGLTVVGLTRVDLPSATSA